MVASGIELLVAARRDPVFGPVVVVGAGGKLVELIADTALRLGVVTEADAGEMLRRDQDQAPCCKGIAMASATTIAAAKEQSRRCRASSPRLAPRSKPSKSTRSSSCPRAAAPSPSTW